MTRLMNRSMFIKLLKDKGIIEKRRGRYYSLCNYDEEITTEIKEILEGT